MTFLKKQKEEPIQDTPTPETASGTTEFDEELTMEEMEAKVQEVMEKYDRESNTRKWVGLPNSVIRYLMVAFAIYCVLINFLFNWETRIERASFVGCIVVFIFLLFPARKNAAKKQNYVPWYDVLLAIAGGVSYFYFVFNCTKIINQGIMIGTTEMIFGIIGILVTLEACRRSVGFPIVIVASVFIIYAMTQRTLLLNVYNLFYTTEGVIGTPIRACSTFIVLFVMFGSFLGKTGITDFFIELANSIAGSSDGGPAKVAVISSALCGMVSGSSVGNTVTTGAITIPMMKRTGYKPEFAGAVEAAASTGGQIMPPIMGAAAFLMAEFVGVPYFDVVKAAVIPAMLYYIGVWLGVHYEAKKFGLKGTPRDQLPKFKELFLEKGHLAIPLIVIVYLLVSGYTPMRAALAAIVLTIVCACLRKSTRIGFKQIVQGLIDGSKGVLGVLIACATAGIIIGVVTKTGVGLKIATALLDLAGGNLLPAMFFTMITSLILGMGVPTTANYVITSTIAAPALVQMNVPVLAAHMFAFYFGIVADVTPPVALAAYAGAGIAGANPMRTGVIAAKLAIAAFIVPYIFVLAPELLMINATPFTICYSAFTAIVGMWGASMAMIGFCNNLLNIPQRILFLVGGICMIIPGVFTDGIGVALVAVAYVWQRMNKVKGAIQQDGEDL